MTAVAIKSENYIEAELQKFNVTDAAIAEMSANYLTIKVTDHTDKENAKLARERRLEVKNIRVAVEKTRKELKADALKFTQAIDGEARRITGLLEPIETHLQAQEDIVAKYKERLEAEERARIAAEQEAERRRLEAERAQLEAEKAEIERQKAEIEATKQREADLAAAVELGRQRAIAEQTSTVSLTPEQLHAPLLKIRVYYHASKENLREKGEAAGLTGEALSLFLFAGEIAVDLFVNPTTGEVKSSLIATV